MLTGNYMANQAGLKLFEADTTADEDASEKVLKGYMSYILDFFKTYELDVENIQNGFYRQPYDLDPRNKQFNPAFVLDQLRRARKVGIETIDRRDRDGW